MSSSSTTLAPDITCLITEDDTPVDNLPSEKHQRLLTEPLYSSWTNPHPGRPFLVAANVGVFAMARNPAIVPDVFLSLDVDVAEDWWQREHRSYFLWEFGKPPDVVIEIVSNTEGEENNTKLQKYAQMRVLYYIIYDPRVQIMDKVLTVYRLDGMQYVPQTSTQLAGMGLGVTLWEGTYEGKHDTWLRWTDDSGMVIPTGKERAEQESQRAEQERQRAEHERQRAEHERQRAEQVSQQMAQVQQHAEQERLTREDALQRLSQAEQRAEQLAALLRQLGHEPPA
ncbi:MAG: Uma2 family endonuclease [Candidatus Tectomicrobia bacterium]|uniref:Uma2 family endonuclease n=1 Tax=Tectimicrobiota bacterium TaxID=2528274 RepID=A0A937VZY1_UNCTE|nr:Uma2 family endonuclease [Candidatus Tectomicrobia bacterium]